MMLPIKQTVLAPAHVSPMAPTLIKSSIDGIISEILVKPNQKVLKGQVLFKLDNIELRIEVDKAKNRLKISRENYRQAFHYSYETNASQGYINILKTEIEKEKNSLKYKMLLLKRSIIKAPLDGTIIFTSPKKWLGKPIKVGEKIMLLAIGNQKQLDINIKLITDGDVLGALYVTNSKYNVDIFLGIGGGPEGVLAASALNAFDCHFQGRFIFDNDKDIKDAKKMGISDLNKKYELNEIIKGDSIFCSTGITSSEMLNGVEILDTKYITETLVTHKSLKFKEIIKRTNLISE